MAVQLLIADAASVLAQFINQPEWGIFLNGAQVVGQGVSNIINTILGQGSSTETELQFEARWVITNAPQEGGAFLSYNRVQTPYRVVVEWSVGGSAANRSKLLQQVQTIMGTTNLYTVLMPEGPIEALNPVGYGFRRRAENVGMLDISILFSQVRPAGDPTFSTTQTPGSPTGLSNAQGAASQTAPITNPTPAAASATSVQSYGTVSPTTVPPTSAFASMVF